MKNALHTSRPRWLIAALAIAVFFAVDTLGLHPFKALAQDLKGWPRIAVLSLVGYGLYLLAPLALTAWLFRPRQAVAALGLQGPILKGLAVALLGTAILAIGYGVLSPMVPLDEALAKEFVRGSLLPGFAEEVLYRGLLFGLLFRFAGWGFLPAVLLAAGLFGAAHLYQSNEPAQAGMIFAITGLGGALAAWLYAEWDFNLWVPIGVHILMNFWWSLFAVDDSALGSGPANLVRLAGVGALIALTLIHAGRRGHRIVRGRAWLRGGPVAEPSSTP